MSALPRCTIKLSHGPDQTLMTVAYNRYGMHWAGSQLATSVVSSTNHCQNDERIASLHHQAKRIASLHHQAKLLLLILSPPPRCLNSTSTVLRYEPGYVLSAHICCVYCKCLKHEVNPKQSIIPALSLLGLPRCMPYWYDRTKDGTSIVVCAVGILA